MMKSIACFLGGLVVVCCGLLTTVSAADPSQRPNVLFIVSDDQAWADYGFMGHQQIATPRIDRLAAESVTFTRGYTPVPLCRPSLATMLTGLYPHQHGVTGNDPDLPEKGVTAVAGRNNPKFARYYEMIIQNFSKRPNLVRNLTSQGYVAFQTGKWWEGDPIKQSGFTHAMTAGVNKNDRHGGDGLAIGRQGIKPVTDFIEQANGQPFFVWYAPMLPHTPHTPPKALLDKYLKIAPSEPVAKYWACVEWFDQTCGELLDYLDQKKLRDNTIVVYVTDNGWLQDPKVANKYAPRSKQTSYEGGVRTPIMISWPKQLKPRMNKEHLAISIDLWPTLAPLLKTKTPENLPGINLLDENAVQQRKMIFGEQFTHNIFDVDQPTLSLGARWVNNGEYKLIAFDQRNNPGQKTELYRISSDPWEKEDLAAKEPERVAELTKALDSWWKPEHKEPAAK